MHRQNTERALFAIAFGDVDTARGLWVIASLSQHVNGSGFLFRGFPGFPIHPWYSFASVFRHSSDGKGFAAQRVGQQMLQGFDLAPPTGLCRLRNTGLEPTNIPLSLTPVNLVPSERRVGGRTNRGI
jgi:hypothetical protein